MRNLFHFKHNPFVNIGPRSKTILLLLLIYAYVILIRIPQLTSNNLLPDQDECVLGMMANHFIKGQNFPLFFYGQHYGLSTVEVLLIVPFIKLLGINVLAIKLPMLLLYMGALTFLFLWIKNNLGVSFAFLITLLFAAEPTWLTWAMKARGGYLSALFVGFYLLYAWQLSTSKKYLYFFNAFLMGLLYHFHLLWFLAFAPLFIFYQRHLGIKKLTYAIVITAATIFIFNWLATTSIELWYKPAHQFHSDIDLIYWRKKFMLFLSGHFYFGYAYNLKYGTLLATKILFGLHILFVLCACFYALVKRKFSEVLLWLLIVTGLFLLPLLAFKGVFHFRYWLPFSVAFIGLIVAVLKEIKWTHFKKVFFVFVIFMAFFGYRAGVEIAKMDIYNDFFSADKIDREKQIVELVTILKQEQKKYFLCNDIALMWLLNYYGNDEVLLRWRISKDRHNEAVQQVNRYYFRNKKIDLLGARYSFKEWLADTANLKIRWLSSDYYLIENMDAKTLEKHAYKFVE